MMLCGLIYNWHILYYPNLVETTLNDDKNHTFTYCNVFFGRQIGYFSFGGFQATQELVYNYPIVNLIVSSLIPFTIVASTNIVIIVYVLKGSPKRISRLRSQQNGTLKCKKIHHSSPSRSSFRLRTNQITKKYVSYETTITLTTSCVFLATNSIASIYVYVKSSNRSDRSRFAEDFEASNVYLVLRMLALIDTVLEFYIYFLTGKKFREEVYRVINEILQYVPFRNYFKFTCLSSIRRTTYRINRKQPIYDNHNNNKKLIKKADSCSMDLLQQQKIINMEYYNMDEILDRIESTV